MTGGSLSAIFRIWEFAAAIPVLMPAARCPAIISLPTVTDFNVRVPQGRLSLADLPKTEIVLYRIKDRPPEVAIRSGPLSAQFGEQLREVARLKGIQLKSLPTAVQTKLKRALR